MVPGDGGEKLVSREETPVDVNCKAGGPRVVFPPLNQNGNPPPVASVSPDGAAAARGCERHDAEQRAAQDQDACGQGRRRRQWRRPGWCAAPPAKPAREPPSRLPRLARSPPRNPASANASANAPLSLAPQGAPAADPAPAPARLASTNPTRRPRAAAAAISSRSPRRRTRPMRRPPTGRCRASSRACSGSRSPVIKRADLGDKGVYYRAMVGPFGSPDEAIAVLRQPEIRRRTVRRPKELTAVSLTRGLRCGLIGPHEQPRIHHGRIGTGTERRRARIHPRRTAMGLHPIQAQHRDAGSSL